MIHIRNLICGYGSKEILHGLDIDIAEGEFVGIIGPNGSGKTTLLKAMTGLMPFKGEMTMDGHELAKLSNKERSRRLASVPQRFSDGLDMRVESLVMMGRYPYLGLLSTYSSEDMDIVESAMKQTDTCGFLGRRAYELSGGELQRVLIARALAQQTPALLLDEATSGLDFSRSIEIFDLLARHNSEGKTILAVIHDLNLAALYCERIIMLKQGKIVFDGSVDNVFTSENLTKVYDAKIKVIKHTETNIPQALYIPGAGRHYK